MLTALQIAQVLLNVVWWIVAAQVILSLLIALFYRAVPVGLITVCLGGIYLIWLLIRETRRHL